MHCNSAVEHFLMDFRLSVNTLLPLPFAKRSYTEITGKTSAGKKTHTHTHGVKRKERLIGYS